MPETNRKKRVLYVITKAELGGAQSHVADLIRGFAPQYDVHLAVGTAGPLVDDVKASGATVHHLLRLVRSINPLNDVAAVQECARLIRRVRPDIVHAHSSKAGIVARLAGRITGVPTVFTAHGWGFSPGVPRARQLLALRIEKAMAPLARKIICVSEFDYQLALRLRVGKKASLVTVHGGISQEPSPNLADTTVQPPRFVMVARFSEQKDQTTLLKALVHVPHELKIDFIGTGPKLAACQAMANDLGLTDRVAFLGDRNDVAELLRKAQGFILSTHYEGFPISILEAMRAGLPVIASDVGGVREAVEDMATGLLVPKGDVDALAQALISLTEAPELRKKLGNAGWHKFTENFTVAKMVTGVEAVYREILTA